MSLEDLVWLKSGRASKCSDGNPNIFVADNYMNILRCCEDLLQEECLGDVCYEWKDERRSFKH